MTTKEVPIAEILDKLKAINPDYRAAVFADESTYLSNQTVMLEHPFDLRGISNKINRINELTLATGWVIFLNQKGSLAHIMHKKDADSGMYFRMNVPYALHGANPEFMRKWFFERLKHRLVM